MRSRTEESGSLRRRRVDHGQPAAEAAVDDPRSERLRELLRDYLGEWGAQPEMAEERDALKPLLRVVQRAAAALRAFRSWTAESDPGEPGVATLRSSLRWPLDRWRAVWAAAQDLDRVSVSLAQSLRRSRGAPAGPFGRLVRGVADVVRLDGERKEETDRKVALFLAGVVVDIARAPSWWLRKREKSLWRGTDTDRPPGQRSTLYWSPTFEITLAWRPDQPAEPVKAAAEAWPLPGAFCVNITQLAERVGKITTGRPVKVKAAPKSRKQSSRKPPKQPPRKPRKKPARESPKKRLPHRLARTRRRRSL
jgi:hypothetical protein